MKNLSIIYVSFLVASLCWPIGGSADETVAEKIETKKNETADSIRSDLRDAKDKVCNLVNGELQCFEKKIERKAKSAAESAKTKAKEIKNKID